jgi:hypothetical protein
MSSTWLLIGLWLASNHRIGNQPRNERYGWFWATKGGWGPARQANPAVL